MGTATEAVATDKELSLQCRTYSVVEEVQNIFVCLRSPWPGAITQELFSINRHLHIMETSIRYDRPSPLTVTFGRSKQQQHY